MSTNPSCPDSAAGGSADAPEAGGEPAAQSRPSRREFLTATAAGLAGAAFAPAQGAGLRSATPADLQNLSATAAGAASCCGEASCSASTRGSATSRRPTS